ncbi:MAG: PSD1 and planctomycete cytochrome C domain-containing protein [Akkermansiaceae bacterium]
MLPLLQENCFKCHSHEAKKTKGGLTLDSRAGWATGGDSGPAVIPGDIGKSLLIQAIRREDEDLAMPPKEKDALSAAEILLLEDWVRNGAIDPRVGGTATEVKRPDADWWSLRPLSSASPPVVAGASHPIDAFLESKRKEAGLSSSPRADRRTLIRRLTYNLHGLPPSPEAVEKFKNSTDPAAYGKLVDDLLNSPRYGERWARHWLDTIHFADSHGCEHDIERPNAWPFRDYVIKRLNADIPWQHFIREQLAADVFQPEQNVALGFIGAGPFEESRRLTAPVTFAYLDRDDMVTQTMSSFTSSTVHCARCHDHKFDPISQEDYYSLQAVFAGVDKGDMPYLSDPTLQRKRQPWETLLQAAERKDATVLLAADQKQTTSEWIVAHDGAATWEPLQPTTFVSVSGADLTVLDDSSILVSGKSPVTDSYVVTAAPKIRTVTALKLELLPHESLPKNGPGRQPENGNLHLNAITCQLFEAGSKTPVNLPIASATADFNQDGWTVAHVLDADPRTAWGIHPKEGEKHEAIFVLEKPAQLKPGAHLAVTMTQSHGDQHVIGRFRLSVSDAPAEHAVVLPPEVRKALEKPEAERSTDEQLTLAAHVAHQRATAAIALLPSDTGRVYGMNKKSLPLTVNVLSRGNIEKPLDEARPGSLSAIAALEGRFTLGDPNNEAARRAALADWLASPENPLTWRSIVNRVWYHHFGRGICDTPNDFGRMGGTPSHPELLDWLAVWFRDDAKGSLKELHRLIVTSDAYCQQSVTRADAALVDSDNRLLWRMNTQRLDAEQYRDGVRQICGRIDLTMGGPGIKHFKQTKGAHLTPKLDYDDYDWNGDDAARRDIYRVVWRGMPDPFMEALDFPNLGQIPEKRGRGFSPLQSLVLLNHDFVLLHADTLAKQLEKESKSTPQAISAAYRQILQREPNDFEKSNLLKYAEKHGLSAMCRLLFNTNEFLYVE